jgi:hypothetical protein
MSGSSCTTTSQESFARWGSQRMGSASTALGLVLVEVEKGQEA